MRCIAPDQDPRHKYTLRQNKDRRSSDVLRVLRAILRAADWQFMGVNRKRHGFNRYVDESMGSMVNALRTALEANNTLEAAAFSMRDLLPGRSRSLQGPGSFANLYCLSKTAGQVPEGRCC